jgi:hypothetical protein
MIIRNCLASNANDNLTCIFICFENFKNFLYENNTFKVDTEKLDKIIRNLIIINNESFIEKENEKFDNDLNSQSSNQFNTNTNHLQTNNNLGSSGINTSTKSCKKNTTNTTNTTKNDNFTTEKNKEKRNLNINWKLSSPGVLKVLSPINNSNINKHFSPTNTINNLNPNFIANNNFNQTTISNNDDGFLNRRIISNKNVNFTSKLDMISPKNTNNPSNKKSYLTKTNIDDNKLKSLPAINVNGNLKKG